MSSLDLTAALLLGVLLPISFARPRFLHEHPMPQHLRRRWNFIYSCAAFAAMGYVYVSGVYLLRPSHPLSTASRNVLGGCALILLAIACAHHLPPLIVESRSRLATAAGVMAPILIGFPLGGFLAVDEVFAHVRHPEVAFLSWALLLLIATAVTVWFSGLSPESRLALYGWRRRRARRRAQQRAV
jgi:hypothetical protein